MGARSTSLPTWPGVLLLRALATAVVLWSGFTAISDDDFARLVIAQDFAVDPRFDPSGTSWLPFPFWLTGSVMALLGPSVAVARGLALLTTLLSAGLVWVAAGWAGLGRTAAWLGAAVAAVLPHAVWLGAATVPEGYSAALCLLAVSSVCQRDPKKRWLGALAITAAALSRYEAWPIAGLLCLLGMYDAFVQQDRRMLAPALCALAGPLLWLAHGSIDHGDALFFVKRVAAYRRALGRSPVDWFSALLGYPKVLWRAEPELFVLSGITLFFSRHALPKSLARLAGAAALVLLFLMLGDLGDGAPTHHPERPLLVIWLVGCLLVGHGLPRLWADKRWTALSAAACVAAFALRPIVTRRDAFIDRSAELEIGRAARDRVRDGRLVVDTDDYAYFAVLAGFERVKQGGPLRDHDPRHGDEDPFASPEALRAQLQARSASFLIVARDRAEKVAGLGTVEASTERYLLLALPKLP